MDNIKTENNNGLCYLQLDGLKIGDVYSYVSSRGNLWHYVVSFLHKRMEHSFATIITNGKLIYEGDIVKDYCTNTVYQIGLKNFAYCLENKKYIGYFHEMSHTFSSSRLKIVGNIYQNEELLNELYETSKLIGNAEC